ncbi:hypothetical protein JCM3765_001248 [Sporobolomyces pararoseus]
MSTNAPPTSNEVKSKDQDGFWASLSPADQKKYTLVFLVSLGTTLLVTGRSGGSLLKRAKKSEASTPSPTVPLSKPTVKKPKKNKTQLDHPQPLSTRYNPPSSSLQTPPTSYLHPNSLSISQTPRNARSRRLLPSFLLPPSPSSSPSSSLEPPSPSSYFLPNTLLTTHSTAYAKELDRQDKLHEDGLTPEQELAERDRQVDDGFNPAVYAMKALGIATMITFTGFGLSIFGLMKWLGVKNMDELSLALTHRLGDTLKENRPNSPSWALPTSSSSPSPTTPLEESQSTTSKEVDEEAVSYWSQVKETLDREAEEKKIERSEKWRKFLEGNTK